MFKENAKALSERQHQLLNNEQVLSIVIKDNDERFDLNTGLGWQPNGSKLQITLPVTGKLSETKEDVKSILENLAELVPFSNLAGREDELEFCKVVYSRLIEKAISYTQGYFEGSSMNMALLADEGVSIRVEIEPRTFMERDD